MAKCGLERANQGQCGVTPMMFICIGFWFPGGLGWFLGPPRRAVLKKVDFLGEIWVFWAVRDFCGGGEEEARERVTVTSNCVRGISGAHQGGV